MTEERAVYGKPPIGPRPKWCKVCDGMFKGEGEVCSECERIGGWLCQGCGVFVPGGSETVTVGGKIVRCQNCIDTSIGMKDSNGKLRYEYIPLGPLRELAKVYTYGATKYAPRNWQKGVPDDDAHGALLRHVLAGMDGVEEDEESGCLHYAHAAFWCFERIWRILEKRKEMDGDRINRIDRIDGDPDGKVVA